MSTVSPYLTRRLRTLEEALVQRTEASTDEGQQPESRDAQFPVAPAEQAERIAKREAQS